MLVVITSACKNTRGQHVRPSKLGNRWMKREPARKEINSEGLTPRTCGMIVKNDRINT